MKNIDELIQSAAARSHASEMLAKANEKMKPLPWLDMEDARPNNDSILPTKKRRTYIVLTGTGLIYVAYYGFSMMDIWVSVSGTILASDFGHDVIKWCPLPKPSSHSVDTAENVKETDTER